MNHSRPLPIGGGHSEATRQMKMPITRQSPKWASDLSAAGTTLGVAKSVLSQHLTKLEAELGVRLIQRSTRRLQVTEVGHLYYECCRGVVAEFENSKRVIDDARGVPRGRVRVSCPINFAQVFAAGAIVGFMSDHPDVEVTLDASNGDVDVLADGYDLVLRVGTTIKSSNLIVRSLTVTRHWLLASPALIARCGAPQQPNDLKTLPSVGGMFPVQDGARHLWRLEGSRGPETDNCLSSTLGLRGPPSIEKSGPRWLRHRRTPTEHMGK